MAEQVAYNIDCMEYMRTLPDNFFDLAVVDPPYGGGARLRRPGAIRRAFRPLSGQSAGPAGSGQPNTEKKLSPGTTRQAKNTLMNCFAYPSNRSSGAAIIFPCRPAGAF
ncbi:MAG TPA: hypothetical protein H9810_03015 [Candidatus Gemmiger excrementavium]|uniref:DNA methylase N-4/N-6 domain-containing protein n=1 Tax=Candidatus Gemmiger excrementavium TaxID=2838608 RepID=A0A9D2JEN3_9FIRM|nr:hypothetical protein [Candidatus Gemmiger excrementavium]